MASNEVVISVSADITRASKSFDTLRSRLERVSRSAKIAGAALTAIGAAGAFGMANFAKAALDQQGALNTLRPLVEATGTSFDSMRKRIIEEVSSKSV